MTGLVTVYITCGSAEEAERLGGTLVEERLAACANVVPELRSIYRWQGVVQRDAEAALLLKTRAALFPALQARARELHAYEAPCVVAWPIVAASEPYARWVLDQTREA